MNQVEIVKEEPKEEGWLFTVKISEGSSFSEHEVTLDAEYWQKFAEQFASPRELVLASFKFLLEREPKESILLRFNLQDISQYFPEYEKTMR